MRQLMPMPTTKLTYKDYCKLPDDGLRYEILDGQVVVSPSAGSDHQGVQVHLSSALLKIERRRAGRVFADLDCELAPHDVVRPDVLVVLRKNAARITKTRVIGAPDLAIEIFSPGGASRDRNSKRRRYEAAGTPELWLVDPVRHIVHRYVHDGTAFGRPTEHRTRIRLHVLPKVEIDLRPVW